MVIIHVPLTDYIDVCLINTGRGVPFISALELRHLDNSIYQAQGGALLNVWGYDVYGFHLSGALYYLTIGFQLPQIQLFILRAMITLITYQI